MTEAVVLAALVLTAAPVKLATSGFTAAPEDAQKVRAWADRFVTVLRQSRRIEVTTSDDLQQLLGMERQKQLLGCDTNTCIAEIAAALGTDGVLAGTITRADSGFVVSLRVLHSKSAQVWWSASGRPPSETALLDWLDTQAEVLAETLAPAPRQPVGPWVLGGVGVAALGVGTTFLVLSNTVTLEQVRNANDVGTLSTTVNTGRMQSGVGVVAVSVGAAALAGALIWGVVAKPEAPQVALVPMSGGALVSVGGAW
ncbi:MAG: FlgO family outer membrane protein [Myxococcaceae bacterium]